MKGFEELTEDGERVYAAKNLHFTNESKCNHKFKRISATKIECVKCHIGFFDSGDFPLDELNEYYGNNIDLV